jgi:RNA polymerase sigma factor (sigma-70 family)
MPERNCCDENLIKELFRKNARSLYQFLYYKYGADNHPKDLVQEAFAKLWKNCHKVYPEKARAFLFTVANNQMLNELAKKKTALKYRQEHARTEDQIQPGNFGEENTDMARLKKALEQLSDEQRVTLMLYRVEGKKHKEIAEMLGISRKAVEKRIYTALSILRVLMNEK